MNISKVDLNLLVYLDVLLREGSVTRAANQLSITQPAMSNGLKRLRDLFKDPLLVRTSDGMTPTKRALELQPVIRDVLSKLEASIQPETDFVPETSKRTFRIMASDYAESTLLLEVIRQLAKVAPNITLDMITPSDVTFHDVEQGKVDMAINRFEELPLSFHQKVVWYDRFACVVSSNNPIVENFTLQNYIDSKHIWVSKTGFGVGVGIDPNEVQKLGWVDAELTKIGQKRDIRVFTRHYHVALQLAKVQNLVATLPSKAAALYENDPNIVILDPPFDIPPIGLKMAWSALLHHDAGHIWLRRLITDVGEALSAQ
ncbi:LysR family transcriptional regulator [Paraglaciecola chathamensis]|jgi:DNA-binding transcriptional LysR family regulator|uniref:LysR family transcriptional regulator n=3 Tax=Paraglaciecola chathamensis TaxID=368405 RepID=A0A8H9IAJ0_9ALTE|nr:MULTISPECIES: LysR family transcriptional regulator [Paraglaciecola]AEE24124.1 transcriptional regulator, LysR family [Glaciecola sp. 4H-3-7+YE-5]MBN25308.1 LysR family transcriptional regulator [Alteromonadaceae bacterium]MBJ2134948.1 LysR family transcriptional regulator [Paraglaciecola chathamensis]MBU3017204.1 LysR family transcriptional regulator [Paraglaciecola agarilytica]MDO6558306.1 LysR family transcriptional regulator [Paraglaciecola chathamensis]|tara:strand:- start:58472 stop:59416 length:945 start_codon:yes stop_codon:yes gene_type:complete